MRTLIHPFVPRDSAKGLPAPKAIDNREQCSRCDEASCMCCWELCKCGEMRMDHSDFKGKAFR